jgi:hypothetical protein
MYCRKNRSKRQAIWNVRQVAQDLALYNVRNSSYCGENRARQIQSARYVTPWCNTMTVSKVHIAAVTAAGHPGPRGIWFKGCILGCTDSDAFSSLWQGLAFEQRERDAAIERLEVSDTFASVYAPQCCEHSRRSLPRTGPKLK